MELNNATFGIMNSYHKNSNDYVFKFVFRLLTFQWAYQDKKGLVWEPITHSSTESALYLFKDLYNNPVQHII